MDCNFAAVSAIQHKQEVIRDAFISELALPEIRQRIFKKTRLDFLATLAMARSLDTARNTVILFSTTIFILILYNISKICKE